MDLFPDLSTLSDPELDGMLGALEREEDDISKRRRLLHGRIDILRAERVSRLKAQVADGSLPLAGDEAAPPDLERPFFEGTGELPPDHELSPMPDLAQLDDAGLRRMIDELEHEEDDVSLQRRVIHGRIDLLRAERTRRRQGGTWDPDSLAEALSQHGSGPSRNGA